MIHCHRAPSRVLWFLIGAATASWLLKRKDADSRIFGHCMRLQYQTPPLTTANSSAPDDDPFSPSIPNSWSIAVRDIPRAINRIPPAHQGNEQQQQSWQQETKCLVSQKVTDAMIDSTEAALESLLSATEALKAKLAEHRTNREQQQQNNIE